MTGLLCGGRNPNALSAIWLHPASSAKPLPLNPPLISIWRYSKTKAVGVKLGCYGVSSRRHVSTDRKGVVISSDDKYGNKQVVSLTPQLYHYILANVREPQILRELREETSTMAGSQMQVSPDQAQLLAMLVQMLGAKWCIEVGVYTGYSSLAVALVLPESGRLVACERDENCLAVAKRYYQRAGVSHKVDVRHGFGIDTLQDLLQNGEANRYDFAFLDAEKRMYFDYYELLLQLIRPGGLIVIDNVLWHGRVADPLINDKKTISLRDFNKVVFNDERVNISMVPIGDGMTLCRKKITLEV